MPWWSRSLARGEHHALPSIRRKTRLFLVRSSVATGLSWRASFRAIPHGTASRVAPLDELSLPLTLLLAFLILHEPLTWRMGVGVTLMAGGALLTLK
ncbi:EamA family transporter [Myxococcus virescens]|uniref:EamA family transporter n=1 Tax=Myxococcus virescens TaxID=83456 RepID=UPI003DA63D24